jgi:hypothetical protein
MEKNVDALVHALCQLERLALLRDCDSQVAAMVGLSKQIETLDARVNLIVERQQELDGRLVTLEGLVGER